MVIISPRIKLYSDWKEPLTPKIVLTDLHRITQQVNQFFGRKKVWYLPGDSRKQALEHLAFNEQGATDKIIQIFEQEYKDEYPFIGKSIWDGEDNDDLTCSISYHNYRRDRLGQTEVSINLNIEEKEFQFYHLMEFVNFLVSNRNLPYIMVETRGYRIKRKQVFPDRLSAGWMLYLPIEIDPALVPMAEEIIPVSDKNSEKGSLIITTKDIFDIENQAHINKANDIEICLRDLQILPLISEI
ncbi:hypothetical protein Xbed_03060 [Xenorhabdus beddingii]|uniref:Uncharacterized protein n=1 Tax=Xenorhabdus beddingii TaxID=40578 RepID=A0A1Y2SIN6_9GAMM|nr:immunity 52 family protein [Xenorhabdus beddingii]OTA18707.1 hypothetical protein Xbed_03060 [Xenorhabdus beddingii]